MTQADPSEPEADDFVADTATDPPNMDVDDTGTTAQQSQFGKPDTDPAVASQAGADGSGVLEALQTDHAVRHAVPAGPEDRANAGKQSTAGQETGRGAGIPAGPLEEFYSPPEHFYSDAAEQRDSLMKSAEVPRMHASAQPAAEEDNSHMAAAHQQHSLSDAAQQSQEVGQEAWQQQADKQNVSGIAKEVVKEPQQSGLDPDCHKDGAEQQRAAQSAKTPMPTKTPANPKRRKGSKRCASS